MVEAAFIKGISGPFHEFLHLLDDEIRWRRFEQDFCDLPIRSEDTHSVLFFFVYAAVRIVLRRVFEQLVMERGDDALTQREGLEAVEHVLESLKISLHL